MWHPKHSGSHREVTHQKTDRDDPNLAKLRTEREAPNRAQMKTDKDVLAHAILLIVMGRLNVARLSVDRDNSQRARL